MGNCSFKHDDDEIAPRNMLPAESVNKMSFNFQYVIGRGGFGQVWRVELKKTKQVFAMKEMAKARIINKRSVQSVINERKLLSQLQHPFLINMNYAFQDQQTLYLVSDLLTGGDLRYHIGKKRRFSEEQTKFMIACIVIGLEYMHNQNVIHRDIKPENIVMEDNGYLRITDMGIAKILKAENSQDTSGTPGYMAPEVMCRQNHGFAVDYFAVGVIGYEFMMGRRPYVGRSRKEIRDMLFSKQVQIRRHEMPENWSLEAADFINKCLQRKPGNRLGLNGPSEVRNHIWLRDFDWQALIEKRMKAPYTPEQNTDNFDKVQANNLAGWKDEMTPEQLKESMMLLHRKSTQMLFEGYHFERFSKFQIVEQQTVELDQSKQQAPPQSAKIQRRQQPLLEQKSTSDTQNLKAQSIRHDVQSSYNSAFCISNPISPKNNSSFFSVKRESFSIDKSQEVKSFSVDRSQEEDQKKQRTYSIKASSILSQPQSIPNNMQFLQNAPDKEIKKEKELSISIEAPKRKLMPGKKKKGFIVKPGHEERIEKIIKSKRDKQSINETSFTDNDISYSQLDISSAYEESSMSFAQQTEDQPRFLLVLDDITLCKEDQGTLRSDNHFQIYSNEMDRVDECQHQLLQIEENFVAPKNEEFNACQQESQPQVILKQQQPLIVEETVDSQDNQIQSKKEFRASSTDEAVIETQQESNLSVMKETTGAMCDQEHMIDQKDYQHTQLIAQEPIIQLLVQQNVQDKVESDLEIQEQNYMGHTIEILQDLTQPVVDQPVAEQIQQQALLLNCNQVIVEEEILQIQQVFSDEIIIEQKSLESSRIEVELIQQPECKKMSHHLIKQNEQPIELKKDQPKIQITKLWIIAGSIAAIALGVYAFKKYRQ